MKITEIDIDRFRIWRSLLLKLNPDGLNVIYGPNEAGKTTLMRFVRSVLYGFEPLEEEPAWQRPEAEMPWKGALRCQHGGRTWRVSRRAQATKRGTIRISGAPAGMEKPDAMSLLLSGTEESIFTDVFAVGVRDLQQLATLGHDQVAEYIYGLSLGPEGRRLLDALGEIRSRRAALHADEGRQGEIPDLFDQYSELTTASGNRGVARERHAMLVRRRNELSTVISALQKREQEMSAELRGLRFISACHKPWKKVQDFREKLDRIPLVQHNPDQALEQLDAAIRDVKKHSEASTRYAEQSVGRIEQMQRIVIDERFEKDRYAVQSLVDQSEWLRGLEQQIQAAESRSSDLKRELDQALIDMGAEWNVDRLRGIDTSPTAHNSLLVSARKYQDALQRRGKLRRWTRSLSRKSQQELLDLETDMTALGLESIDEAIQKERERLTELENLGRLRLQREQMGLKIKTVRNVMSRVDTDDSIPPWVDSAVNTMTIVSMALFMCGVILLANRGDFMRVGSATLAAAAFGFAGIMWWGIRNGLRNYFDRKTGIQLDDLNAEVRQAEKNLRVVHDRIKRIQSEGIAGQYLLKLDAPGSTTADLVNCIGECSRHITELETLARRQDRARVRRERLRTLRQRFRSAQQTVVERRHEWCQLLVSLGLDETVKVQEAFDWWQRVQEVRELHTQWRNIAPEAEGLKRMFGGMRDRVHQLGTVIAPESTLNYDRPLEVLTAWEQQLKTHERDRVERERLKLESEELRRESQKSQSLMEGAELRRGAVFARAGVLSREELLQQVEWQQERDSIEKQIESTNGELIDVSTSEPELAVVEEDLARFDPRDGRERILLLEAEQSDLEKQLNGHHVDMGRIKQEITVLETSRESQTRYFQKAHIATDIYRATEEWLALQIEEDVVQTMRRQFEKENISSTLTTASSYLHRISSGRYHKVWAPLGENFLCVDDEYGRTFRVEQLSGGTREQVFLALRFALVREFASRGIELPVIMDDLFVNFDEERTRAAADCLIEIASEGQQILFFTCHQHLAELFQQKKVEPLWLPGHKVAYDIHKAEDEAAAFIGVDEQAIESAVADSAEAGSLKGVFHPNADELFEEESAVEDAATVSVDSPDDREIRRQG